MIIFIYIVYVMFFADNAYDPDVNAKQLWIDKTIVNEQECLSFMDNGNGLNHETMHKMLRYCLVLCKNMFTCSYTYKF